MMASPVPKAAKVMAVKALLAGTALCASVCGTVAGAVIYFGDFKSVDDFQTRMRLFVPSIISPVPKALERVGMNRKVDDVTKPTEFEIQNLDQTMNQAFGKSDYYKEFKPEDYAHQKMPDPKL